eukprot:6610831-Lingulodinium_polyedra.AAC.1
MTWRMRRGTEARNWLLRASQNRRWLRSRGEEWRLVSVNSGINGASHIFRLLAGGAQGKAQRRSRRDRVRALRCSGCACTDGL